MVLAWENLEEVFVMLVVVVVLPHWRFLRFWTTFSCHRHSTLFFQALEGLHQLWALPWQLSVALILPGFSVTVLPRALRFWVGVFLPTGFFILHSYPTLWHVFVTQMWAETPYPGSSSVPVLIKFSLPADAWSWATHIVDARQLGYQLDQWATKYWVKTLLNMFQPAYACSKSYGKDYKQDLLMSTA